MSLIKFLRTIPGIVVLLTVLCINSSPAREKESKISLQSMAPGSNVRTMARLGMPFPDDTSGIHYFINPGDSGVLMFYVEGPDNRRRIKWIQVIYRELLSEEILLDGHQMKSSYPLATIGLGNGIGLGAGKSDIIKAMGTPEKLIQEGKGEVMEYPAGENMTVRIHLQNDIAVSAGIYPQIQSAQPLKCH